VYVVSKQKDKNEICQSMQNLIPADICESYVYQMEYCTVVEKLHNMKRFLHYEPKNTKMFLSYLLQNEADSDISLVQVFLIKFAIMRCQSQKVAFFQ